MEVTETSEDGGYVRNCYYGDIFAPSLFPSYRATSTHHLILNDLSKFLVFMKVIFSGMLQFPYVTSGQHNAIVKTANFQHYCSLGSSPRILRLTLWEIAESGARSSGSLIGKPSNHH